MNRHNTTYTAAGRWLAPGERDAAASVDRVLAGAALVAVLVTAASFLARASWLLELSTHFRFQLALGSTVLLVAALMRRRLFVAALAALSVAANAAPLVPWIVAGPAVVRAAEQPVRLMSANVYFRNADYAALLEQVREQDPDVLGLLEVDRAWLDGLSVLEAEYPWTVFRPEEGAYGLALYSRLPFRPLPESPYSEDGLQTAVAVELDLGQQPVTLVLAHVRAPTSPARARMRNAQFARLSEMLRDDDNAAKILIGDLNTTPWSPWYRQLASTAQMKNAALGQGYLPTWPAGFGLLGIPIDHCLVSDALLVESFKTGGNFGSDHLPIVVELAPADEAVPYAAR